MSVAVGLSSTVANGQRLALVAASLALLSLASCNSGPARVNQPYIDSAGAGAAAMELYDTNGDGKVAGDEFAKAPGLQALIATTDADKDGGLSADEIAVRLDQWKEQKVGVTSFSYRVTLDGAPLEGAEVTFEPESFLGDEIQAAVGVTGAMGNGSASIPKERRPSPQSPPGMHIGLYRVKISKKDGSREVVPTKYNENTILGQEVAFDVREILNNRVVYELTTK